MSFPFFSLLCAVQSWPVGESGWLKDVPWGLRKLLVWIQNRSVPPVFPPSLLLVPFDALPCQPLLQARSLFAFFALHSLPLVSTSL